MSHTDKRPKDRSPAELLPEGHPLKVRHDSTRTFSLDERKAALNKANRPPTRTDRWARAREAGLRIVLACGLALLGLAVVLVVVYAL